MKPTQSILTPEGNRIDFYVDWDNRTTAWEQTCAVRQPRGRLHRFNFVAVSFALGMFIDWRVISDHPRGYGIASVAALTAIISANLAHWIWTGQWTAS